MISFIFFFVLIAILSCQEIKTTKNNQSSWYSDFLSKKIIDIDNSKKTIIFNCDKRLTKTLMDYSNDTLALTLGDTFCLPDHHGNTDFKTDAAMTLKKYVER